MQRRVVITGMGIWSCLGNDVAEVEASLRAGKSGIGLDNVIKRLRLYYNSEDLLSIRSEGKGMGTEVTILLPSSEGGNNRVSNFDRR